MNTKSTTPAPIYLLLDATGVMHSYWTRSILVADVAMNRTETPQAIYKQSGYHKIQLRYKRVISRMARYAS